MAKTLGEQMGFFAAVPPATVPASVRQLATTLPRGVSFGTSSWSFPGWDGLVYGATRTENEIAQKGLEAYAQHPLLGAVGVDRTFYAPVPTSVFDRYAEQAPAPFRFLVKCPQQVTRRLLYGADIRSPNADFLDADVARDIFFAPLADSPLSARATVLVQLTHEPDAPLSPEQLANRLDAFFAALATNIPIALEVRTPAYLHPAVREVIKSRNVRFCVTAIRGMPPPLVQAERMAVFDDDELVARWMLRADLTYQEAKRRFAPFTHMGRPDLATRDAMASLILRFAAMDKAALVIVNNKAEGSAPRTIWALAKHLTR